LHEQNPPNFIFFFIFLLSGFSPNVFADDVSVLVPAASGVAVPVSDPTVAQTQPEADSPPRATAAFRFPRRALM